MLVESIEECEVAIFPAWHQELPVPAGQATSPTVFPCAWVLQFRFSELGTLVKGRLRTSHGKHSFSHGSYPPELYIGPQKLRIKERSLRPPLGAGTDGIYPVERTRRKRQKNFVIYI